MESKGDDSGFVGRSAGEEGVNGIRRWVRFRRLKRTAIGVVVLWVVVFLIPQVIVEGMVKADKLVPDALFYYPQNPYYWIYSGLLTGWKGVAANVYIWEMSDTARIVGMVVVAVAWLLLLAVACRGEPNYQIGARRE